MNRYKVSVRISLSAPSQAIKRELLIEACNKESESDRITQGRPHKIKRKNPVPRNRKSPDIIINNSKKLVCE